MRIAAPLAVLLALAGVAAAESATLTVDAPESAPATMYLVANVTGPRDLELSLPPGASVDALALDGGPVPWRHVDRDTLLVPLPPGAHDLRLHAVLPGAGPWRVAGLANLTVLAPGLDVARAGDAVTIARPAHAGPPAWIAVAAASAVSVGVAFVLARRTGAPAGAPMGLLDHLRELQSRLRASLVVVFVLVVAFAAFGLRWATVAGRAVPVPAPGEPTVATAAYNAIAAHLVPEGVTLVVLRPMDAVMAEIWVALLLAILASMPVVAYEAAAFFGPALLPKERNVVLSLALPVLALFLVGAAFAYLLLVPLLLATLYEFAPGLGAVAFLSVPDLVGFAALLCVVMGAVFEVPVVMAGLARAGVVAPRTFAAKWRVAIVVIFVVAAFVTPDPTVVSQLFVALPMTALYFLGVAAAYAAARR